MAKKKKYPKQRFEQEVDMFVNEGQESFHVKPTVKRRSEDGWELVSVVPRITNGTGDNFHLFWKRPVED